MALTDTSPAAEDAYFRRLAEMSPEERVNLAFALREAGDALQRAALRREYPDATADEILFYLAVSRFGEELARKAYRRL
ncbi:MAG TPA: hypothetical protein VHA14_01290 [Bryobacteraceae bacterium]|nr:hypothetical protein [Bryobacteraceae bacterium]